MAQRLRWLPQSLYESAVTAVALNHDFGHGVLVDIDNLQPPIQVDIYLKLFRYGRLSALAKVFASIDVFSRCLTVHNKRPELHQCFQAILDDCDSNLARTLVSQFQFRCENCRIYEQVCLLLRLGFELSAFLTEAGWFVHAGTVIEACLKLTYFDIYNDHLLVWRFDALVCLLESSNSSCNFTKAAHVIPKAEFVLASMTQNDVTPCSLPLFYCQQSVYQFSVGKYEQSFELAIKSMQVLDVSKHCLKLTIQIFRHCSRVLCQKRLFKPCEILIKHAVSLARCNFDEGRNFSEIYCDFGLYLMGVDLTDAAVKAYQTAVDYRKRLFGGKNLKLALAHEELAYALYVRDYLSGEFQAAKEHAEKAMSILADILPSDHLMVASSGRIKALVLEEIALDNPTDTTTTARYFSEAEELHLNALKLSRQVFGEDNLLSAKHYGNLGRLYQSMAQYQKAEEMHRNAIRIKQELLGPDDHEVALSMGHLASLLNYDFERFEEAEILHLKAIDIGQKKYGPAYSSLEYEYRGLIRIYQHWDRYEEMGEYSRKLHDWHDRRTQLAVTHTADKVFDAIPQIPRDSTQVLDEFWIALQLTATSLRSCGN